jgi:hypothetical protein
LLCYGLGVGGWGAEDAYRWAEEYNPSTNLCTHGSALATPLAIVSSVFNGSL